METQVIVTGSSSELLSSEFAALLSGRHIVVNMLPLGLQEFLSFKGIASSSNLDVAENLEKITNALEEYMIYGGFPAVVGASEKNEILGSYFETILLKDVANRYKIRAVDKLKVLAKFYLTNIGHSITYNSVSKFTRLPVKTVERFSWQIESSLMLFFVNRFSFSVKEQENSPRKVYSIDTGIAYAVGFNITIGRGALMENIVAVELKRRGLEFYYWIDTASGKEVDFVIRGKEGGYVLMQVAESIDNPTTLKREPGALKAAAERFKNAKLLLIVHTIPTEHIARQLEAQGIELVQLWKWLLQKPK